MADTIDLLRPLRRARIKGWEAASALPAWLYRGGRRTYERLRMAWKRLRYTSVPGIPSQIHLSWTQDPSTSLTMTWYTPSPDNPNLVEYRELGQADWTRVSGATSPYPGIGGGLHRVTVTRLNPATEYEYRVSSDRDASPAMSEIFRTRTAPPPGPADFRFAFICDTGLIGRLDGNSTGTKQIIDEVLADSPLFVLGGGDYAYANRDGRYEEVADAIDSWFVQMQPLLARFPFMAQYGNHEICARRWLYPGKRLPNVRRDLDERYEDWAPRFAHPDGFQDGKSYSFDVGDAHFTGLFVPGSPPSADQLAWLDADLAKARCRAMRWLIVFQHQPIYAHGHSHPADPEICELLAPIFEKHLVDLHLSGHDQNYERTYPLIGVPDNPSPTCDSRDSYKAGAGVIYAKVSPSGKMSEIQDDFSRFTAEQQRFIAVRDDMVHHYALITVRATRELVVNIYSVVGDGAPKTALDSFCVVASS